MPVVSASKSFVTVRSIIPETESTLRPNRSTDAFDAVVRVDGRDRSDGVTDSDRPGPSRTGPSWYRQSSELDRLSESFLCSDILSSCYMISSYISMCGSVYRTGERRRQARSAGGVREGPRARVSDLYTSA